MTRRRGSRASLLVAALALAAAALAACGGDAPAPPAPPQATAGATAAASPTVASASTPVVRLEQSPWDEARWAKVLETMAGRDIGARTGAIEEAVRLDELGMIPVLTELQRFWIAFELQETVNWGLWALTGEDLGGDWGAAVEWLGAHPETPLPPGFADWKADLYATRVDPAFSRFMGDGLPSTIRAELVQWGGVSVDGIPALVNPSFVAGADARYLVPDELVFGVDIEGDARAYPLRILDWHEMANDVVGGVPVALAYCTLCGAGVLYDARVGDEVLEFGSSGLLYESNKLMYDRATDTLWNQLTGEPVVGARVGSGVTLRRLPVVVSDWGSWLERHPGTLVLDIDTGYERDYSPGAAYGEYFASPSTLFPVFRRSQALPEKSFVFALLLDGTPKAYPLRDLQERPVVNDEVAGSTLVVVTEPASRTVRAYERGDLSFRAGAEPGSLVDESGATWRLTEEALAGPDGASLPRLPGHLAYWFGWFSFYPQTLLLGD